LPKTLQYFVVFLSLCIATPDPLQSCIISADPALDRRNRNV